ncbi:MAG: ABC transporter ATP-binding protein [Planctomycetota bacterium]
MSETSAAAHSTLVELRDYTVRYGSFTAVDRASFVVPEGACGLLGQNGAGKSSILKAVLGLLEPAGGSARVLGYDAATDGLQLRDHIGYMPERDAAFPGLTALESVLRAARLSGLPAREARRRSHEVLFLCGVGEERYRKLAEQSTGMRQKVKLAQALVHDPALLFLDEPTNGLDPGGRIEVLALLRSLVRDHGKSMILSSHILSDVESLCAHVVLIDKGRIVAQGPLAEMTKGAGRAFRVGLAGDGEAFARELAARGLEGERLGPQSWLVRMDSDEPGALFAVALAAGAQIRHLEADRRSLTDVFLASVGKSAREAG